MVLVPSQNTFGCGRNRGRSSSKLSRDRSQVDELGAIAETRLRFVLIQRREIRNETRCLSGEAQEDRRLGCFCQVVCQGRNPAKPGFVPFKIDQDLALIHRQQGSTAVAQKVVADIAQMRCPIQMAAARSEGDPAGFDHV